MRQHELIPLKDLHRPAYHFLPERNWMNDPNGLVFYDGEYHLFYQHNPFGNEWGHMSWGHAVSRDLLHWEHLPIALQEEDGVMIYSGSAIVDWRNTSGFGAHGAPPLVAVYTGHSENEQTQNIAYSTDRGRTWTKYRGNPVIAIGSREFRDPKVFWHEPSKRWIMVTVLSDLHKVRFDGSADLKHWSHLSDFGPAGAVDGLWECPDLFLLPIEDEPAISKWVLKVDALKGTGAQYFVGDFDGTRFVHEAAEDSVLRVDYGADFYAAQSWSDDPEGRRIWIGWLNNWHYANDIPTSPWRGVFSVPRQLHLRRFGKAIRLVQQPLEELKQLRQPLYQATNAEMESVNAQLAALEMDTAQEIRVEFTLDTATEFGLKICTGKAQETSIGYDLRSQEMFMDRRHSGDSSFSDRFATEHRAPLSPDGGKIRLHIFVDSCSVEIFGDDGSAVISDLIFPPSENSSLTFYARGGGVNINALDIWRLKEKV
jgi:fructan beta-fructosidase